MGDREVNQSLHESLLAYRGSRYLWWALVVCTVSIIAYARQTSGMPPNGGTGLGYALGTLGAVLVIWLMAFGIRKRAYASRAGTVQGWLSAHVYLGVSLLVVVTLHAGFQVGWNVHTLAYVLMCTVVASGVFGVFVYLRYPQFLSSNRAAQVVAAIPLDLVPPRRERLAAQVTLDPPVDGVEVDPHPARHRQLEAQRELIHEGIGPRRRQRHSVRRVRRRT